MANHAQNKTQSAETSVHVFLSGIKDERQRKDAEALCALMSKITGESPGMWGPGIIGFDRYYYKYESGREGDMEAIGFSPRKSNLTIYLVDGCSRYSEFLSNLGPHKTGKVCLHIKRLSNVNINVLEEIIKTSYQYVISHKDYLHRAAG